MTAREIYAKTMRFNWLKLGIGVVNILISLFLFFVFGGIAFLFNSSALAFVMICIWLALTIVFNFLIMHNLGYVIKAAHIAILSTAVTKGQIPDNQIKVGKEMVKERFSDSNFYSGIEKLITGALKELQIMFEKAGNIDYFLPKMKILRKYGKLIIKIFLKYINECCLGYTFFEKEEETEKSAADGVAIFTKNWKTLLKNGLKTSFKVILFMIIMSLVSLFFVGGIFKLLQWNMFVAVILSIYVASVIKFAFVDSWILINTMEVYMEAASKTELSFEIYDELCENSSSFYQLFEQFEEEQIEELLEIDKAEEKQESLETDEAEEKQEPLETDEAEEKQEPLETDEAEEKQEPLETDEAEEKQESLETDEAEEKQEPVEIDEEEEKQESLETEKADKVDQDFMEVSEAKENPEQTEIICEQEEHKTK